METVLNIIILISFLIEVGVLTYFEKKIWNTIYTPLNFLMLPYTLVLLVTIIAAGKMGYVDFYFPSILLWSIGLLLFFIPSIVWSIYFNRKYRFIKNEVETLSINRPLIVLIQVLIFLFALRLISVIGSSEYFIGSDEFGVEYCGGGLWGHLRVLTSPLLMILIFQVDKKHKIYWLYIICLLVINTLYQVKGWVIIPCVAGIALRLYSNKMKLNSFLFFKIFLFGYLIFQLSYALTLTVAGDSTFGVDFVEEISGHFFHYLTSGTFGLSMDMKNGFPDRRTIEVILAPLYNLHNIISGEELVSSLNPLFYYPFKNGTNVRTFFGTLYINTTYFQFVIYIWVFSSLMYILRIISVISKNIMINIMYFFLSSMICMGWFDFYFASLEAFELPLILVFFIFLQKIVIKTDKPFSILK